MEEGLTEAGLDDLAIIVTEAQRLAGGDDAGAALATIAQAVHHLRLMLWPSGQQPNPDKCAKLTHHDGLLVERYAAARSELSRIAEEDRSAPGYHTG